MCGVYEWYFVIVVVLCVMCGIFGIWVFRVLCVYRGALVFAHVLLVVCIIYAWYETVMCVGDACLVCHSCVICVYIVCGGSMCVTYEDGVYNTVYVIQVFCIFSVWHICVVCMCGWCVYSVLCITYVACVCAACIMCSVLCMWSVLVVRI